MLLPNRRTGFLIVAVFAIILFFYFTFLIEPRAFSISILKDAWPSPQVSENNVELGAGVISEVSTGIDEVKTSMPTATVEETPESENTGVVLEPPKDEKLEESPQKSSQELPQELPQGYPNEEPAKEEISKEEPPVERPHKEDTPKADPPKENKPYEIPDIDIGKYLKNVGNFDDNSLKRVKCPAPDDQRYGYLRTMHFPDASVENPPSYKPYFITLNLHDSIEVIPRLLGSIIEAIRVLGPYNVVLRIVEGRSTDGTLEVLSALKEALPEGTEYLFETSTIDPTTSGRIGSLAALRNLAIDSLITHASLFSADNTTVIFLNDVAACPDDILELIHQKFHQEADMTCAMDWNFVDFSGAYRLTFYDVWIARTMSGESFFHIPFGGIWNESMYLFSGDNDADRLTKQRYNAGIPFQVFACWNGGVVFNAKPIMNDGVRFRLNRADECYQGEVSLFCKDLWLHGYGRIAVVPSVNLAYDDTTTKLIQSEFGLPSVYVRKNARNEAELIPWQKNPPEKMRCIPDWVLQEQYWVPWNE